MIILSSFVHVAVGLIQLVTCHQHLVLRQNDMLAATAEGILRIADFYLDMDKVAINAIDCTTRKRLL